MSSDLTDNTRTDLAQALATLVAGEAVVYPTETFYGIGVDALSPAALERLFAIKEREPDKPVALIAADATTAFALAREVPQRARRLAAAFWPGPLTLVLPAREGIPAALIGPDGGVGVRVSSHPLARALAAGLGRPISATSANLAGQPPAVELEAARRTLGSKVKVFLDGGTLNGGAPSTVVAVSAHRIRIIRSGAIAERELTACIEPEKG
ncbi:MAG TPA: L-threonylcarbamoyladenylate synthase [Candidatus Binataceae bacterium]|nr:L-threonylcarbamoyladenylate synthase [Candidatus Binataceae bacterium]